MSDKEKNPQAQAMARLRWSKVSKKGKREHALKMVKARETKRAIIKSSVELDSNEPASAERTL